MPSLLDSALGWMQDPRRTQQLQGTGRAIQQGLLNIQQSDKRFQDLFDKSFGDPKQPFKVTDKKALSELTQMTQSGLLGMAEVGMLSKAVKGLSAGTNTKPINLEKGIYKPDLTMEEMLKVRDIPTVERVQQSLGLVGEKEFEKMVNSQFKKYKPSSPEQEAMLVESVTLEILGKAQRSPFPRQEALDTAQKNAALPIKEGGLGLPKDNTPEMRAQAMGFETPVYHATDVAEDFSTFIPSTKGKLGAGIYTSPSAKYTEKYVDDNARILPLLTRGNYANEDVGTEIAEKIRQEMYDINPNFAVQEWKARTSQELKNLGYAGKDVDKERVVFAPENVRSRFAAFDPMRSKEPDILAGVLPLGLLADEEQRKKLYELMPSLLGQ